MLIGLPALSLIFLTLFYKNKFPRLGWRAGSVLSAVTLAFLSVVFIEVASLFSAVTTIHVTGFWLCVALLAVGLLGWSVLQRLLSSWAVPKFGLVEYFCISGIILVFLINAMVAFFYPPNNWDSMTYHLPRVMHWAMNAGVQFYPTIIDRQLFYQPGAEFFLLQIFLLTGDDRWFNFLQWMSLLGCVLNASLVAELLGASLRGQLMTALFVSTLPMAVLQSTSTQNDLFVSYWIMAFVALMYILQLRFSRLILYAASAALGLSALVKGTFLVAIPFVVYFLPPLWKKHFKNIVVSLGIVLVLVSGHYARSWAWQDRHELISHGQTELMLKKHSPGAIMANALSQMASELMLPWEPVNQTMERWVQVFDKDFASPIYPNLVFDEDYASNPLHFILIIAAFLLLWRLNSHRIVRVYGLAAMASCLVFVFVIKWQPWVTRLQLPLLILCSPLVGVLIGPRRTWLVKLIALALMSMALVTIVCHQTRPLMAMNNPQHYPREVFYFMKKGPQYWSYHQAAKAILASDCREIGLIEGEDSWEYPLWALTGFGKVHFRSFDVNAPHTSFPCMVVSLDAPHKPSVQIFKAAPSP